MNKTKKMGNCCTQQPTYCMVSIEMNDTIQYCYTWKRKYTKDIQRYVQEKLICLQKIQFYKKNIRSIQHKEMSRSIYALHILYKQELDKCIQHNLFLFRLLFKKISITCNALPVQTIKKDIFTKDVLHEILKSIHN
jgi:hypothetical protein